MIYYITEARHIKDCRFHLQFNTGEEGELDLQEVVMNAPGEFGRTFRDNPQEVRNFYLDPWPTLAWKCGYDIAPEYLHELFTNQNVNQAAEKHGTY